MNNLYQYSGTFKQAQHRTIQISLVCQERERSILNLVREVRQIHPDMGARSIYLLTRPEGIGINKFEKIVIESGLGVKRKKKSWKTTDSKHRYHKYPNLTNGLRLTDVNQLWVTDITYYIIYQHTFYIILIMDVYSRRILGYKVSNTMFLENNLEALQRSFEVRNEYYYENLIHHSDKGSQYCSFAYIDALVKANCRISMADNSLENGYAERLNGIIKNKYLEFRDITCLKSMEEHTHKSIEAYNLQKPHTCLPGSRSPISFENYIKTLTKEERPIMELYNFKPPG
jgi:putative transposase